MRRLGSILVLVALVAAYFVGLPEEDGRSRPAFEVPDPAQAVPQSGDTWQESYVSDAHTEMAHAPSLVELDDGRIRAFWFAGTEEGAANVSIDSAVFDPETGQWGPAHEVLTRQQVARGLNRHVRKLGNMVPVRHDNKLSLYVVAVSFGGWAGSRIAVAESKDQGDSWTINQGLVTSPFINLSTLVKAPPVRFADGAVGLPVYHELIGKFGELLRLDQQHQVLSQDYIGRGREALQPLVLVSGPDRAKAFLRNASAERPGMLFTSSTEDRAEHWTPLHDSGLPNPGSAVSGVALGQGHWLMTANNNARERDDLMIMETRDDGESWNRLKVLHNRRPLRDESMGPKPFAGKLRNTMYPFSGELSAAKIVAQAQENKCSRGSCEFQFGYPYMLRADNGDIHVVYTWNKTMIAHAWWRAPDNGEQ